MFNLKSGSKDLIRRMNRSLVLNMIRLEGPTSRAQIARESGLAAATISSLVEELIQQDLVFEREEGESSGGRRPVLLSLNPAGRFAIGVSLREDRLAGALVDLNNSEKDIRVIPLDEMDPEEVIAAIRDMVDELLEVNQIMPTKLLGVGLGLPGVVEQDAGQIVSLPLFGWEGVPFGALVREALGVPILMDREVNCLALAEKWFGMAKDLAQFIAIKIGPQISMGVISNGRLYHGRGGVGGLGHVVVDPDGGLCSCGKHGCLEALVADPYLVHSARAVPALTDRVDSVGDLWVLAEEGNLHAGAIGRRGGAYLGLAIANLVELFDPQMILLTGEGVRHWGAFSETMFDAIDMHSTLDTEASDLVRIRELETPDRARAAADLVLQTVFESPIYQLETDTPA
jgi:predicted NBD/HSP70 family sugar kinase